MAENFILILFAFLPLALFGALRFFFRVILPQGSQPKIALLICGNLLVLLFLLSCTLLSAEIYFRFVYDSTDSFGLCRTTQRWFERHYHRNATGFRDSLNYMPTAQHGTPRISFVGDSFTAGHGIADVEKRFANIVRQYRPDIEVHVLAECGWDTGNELQLLEFIPTSGYETDCVVLVYCLNDVADIVPEWLALSRRLYEAPSPGFFFQQSFALNTLYSRIRARSEPQVGRYYGFIRQGYEGELWKRQVSRLQALKKQVDTNGWKLLVVTFPFVHALHQQEYPYTDIHKLLRTFWAEQRVEHLDLLSAFDELNSAELTVNSRDAHPNEFSHQLAATAIREFLKQHVP